MRVNVDSSALSDPRFRRLGARLGTGWHGAIGRCLPVWMAAYAQRSPVMPAVDIDAIAELQGFASMLLDVGLARTMDDGLWVCGVRDRVDWLLVQDAKREKALDAKRARVGLPPRGPRGRPTGHPGTLAGDGPQSKPGDGPYSPAPAPAPAPALTLDPAPVHAPAQVRSADSPPAAGTNATSSDPYGSKHDDTTGPEPEWWGNPKPKEPPKEPKPRKKPAHNLPADWKPTAQHETQARDRGVDLDLEARRFRAHAEANDRRAVVWNAAFTQWLLKAEPPRARTFGWQDNSRSIPEL